MARYFSEIYETWNTHENLSLIHNSFSLNFNFLFGISIKLLTLTNINFQSEVLNNLINSQPNPQNQFHMENAFSEIICAGLQNVSEKCYVSKLSDCYDEQEAQFHLAFLLEELRLTGKQKFFLIFLGQIDFSDLMTSLCSKLSKII